MTSTVTARVETEFPLTLTEGNLVRAAAARINAEQWGLSVANVFLDGLRLALNVGLETAPWLVYRGGSHVALIKDGERILFAVEDTPRPDVATDECPKCSSLGGGPLCKAHQTAPVAAPQAPQATTVAPPAVGATVNISVNQGVRPGDVIAVRGAEYLVEYEMPKGTTALQVFRVGSDWGTSVSYTGLNRQWLQAIVDGGLGWLANPQRRSAPVPSPEAQLAAKGGR